MTDPLPEYFIRERKAWWRMKTFYFPREDNQEKILGKADF
jgi:hypothetical protein